MTHHPGAPPISVGTDGRVQLFNYPVYLGGQDQFVTMVEHDLVGAGKHLVVTANLDQWIDLMESPRMRAVYDRATVVVLDGTPLVWLSRSLGAKEAHRITGADLIFELASSADRRGWRVAIVGGRADVARSAQRKLGEAYPGGQFVAVEVPFVSEVADPQLARVAEELMRLQPDVVFLCMGAPKQESFFVEWEEALPEAVYIGAGAAVDFAGGSVRRAPRTVQAMGFEWFWRLVSEPRRLARRYLWKSQRAIPLIWRSYRER